VWEDSPCPGAFAPLLALTMRPGSDMGVAAWSWTSCHGERHGPGVWAWAWHARRHAHEQMGTWAWPWASQAPWIEYIHNVCMYVCVYVCMYVCMALLLYAQGGTGEPRLLLPCGPGPKVWGPLVLAQRAPPFQPSPGTAGRLRSHVGKRKGPSPQGQAFGHGPNGRALWARPIVPAPLGRARAPENCA